MILALFALGFCSLDVKLPAGPARPEAQVHTVVLHHTALPSFGDSIRTLRLRGMSYHYVIDEEGLIVQTVPFTRTAYQAAGANRRSVGISFVGGATAGWAPTAKQRDAAKALIAELVQLHPRIRYLVGHGDIRHTNAGEPYGVDLEALSAELHLQHPGPEDDPLRAYRAIALERLASPKVPPKPAPTRVWPEHESITCPGGKRLKYAVSPGLQIQQP